MTVTNEDIGKRIRGLRESKNMTIQDLADAISCDYDHLQKAEKGKRGLSLDVLISIAQVFGITMDELLFDTKTNDPRTAEILTDIETIYEASKRLWDSARYAGYFGVLCRTDSEDAGLFCNQQLAEEERICMNRKMDSCIRSLKSEYDSSTK